MEVCLLTIINSLRFFFDQSVLQHFFSIIKEKFDFSQDLNGFKKEQEKKKAGDSFVDNLSILYKMALNRLKVNRRYVSESGKKEILYFLRNFRFVFSTPNSEKKINLHEKSSSCFFLRFNSKSLKFKSGHVNKKKFEIEKYFIDLQLSLSVETFKDQGSWVISKIINLFHFRFFTKCPHVLNHTLLSFFSSSHLERKNFIIVQTFFFTNQLAVLNINKFSFCLKSFFSKIIKNSKEMDLMTKLKFSDLTALHFTNLGLNINSRSMKSKQILFPQTLWFLNQILQTIFWLNTIELFDLRINQAFFFQKKFKFLGSNFKKKKIEFLRNLLVQKKENLDCNLLLKNSVRILFRKKLKTGISFFLTSLLFSNWPISFKLILMDTYSSLLGDFSISEAIRFIILKSSLDFGSSFIFSKTYILLEKLISKKILNINQVGREILRKIFFKSLSITYVLKNLIHFNKKINSNKYSVGKDKNRFKEYLKQSNIESKKFIMNAYFNSRKAEKLWKNQLIVFESSMIENIFLLINKLLFNLNTFFSFSYIYMNSNPFLFTLNYFISFWETFLDHKKSFFIFKIKTKKNKFLFENFNKRFKFHLFQVFLNYNY